MAPGLQDLIDFLLNEVALCGDQGATLSVVLQAIDTFYGNLAQDATQRKQSVDRRFQAKVWSWLTRNPEVSVGKDNEWNHLNLDDVEQLGKSVPEPSSAAEGSADDLSTSNPVRIFVSEERTWYAITGHEPDDSKVFPLEFVLLSIIASHKSQGIAQPELVRLSGQDKRSVPKRTDKLAKNGYIEKRAVQVKSSRTSICTLRKFVQQKIDRTSELSSGKDEVIDFEGFTTKLFEILQKQPSRIMARNDLKSELNFTDKWRWRLLSRAIRKFERIGVLKRVKAQSQYDKMHPCVMLLRDPTPEDLKRYYEYRHDMLDTAGDQEDRVDADEDVEMETEEKTAPSWTPDRNLHNQLVDIVDKSGTAGIPNQDIIRALFGNFFRRPLETALQRIVNCWQLSQPLHLRHLAIVRDTAMLHTTVLYVHYTSTNFRALVETGQALWEAVEYPAKKAKTLRAKIPPVDAVPELDHYGFPQTGPPKGLLKKGNATLFECIAAAKPSNYLRSSSDPTAVRLQDGSWVIRNGHQRAPAGGEQAVPVSVRRPGGRPKGSRNRPKLMIQESPAATSESDEGNVQHHAEDLVRQTPTLSRMVAKKHERLKGLSKRERFEALGMDETWTEYSALIMERPTPGVYVTPHGRRRPAGKARGRPRQSRIAVFKSPMLNSLSWFVKELDDSDGGEVVQSKETTPAHIVADGGTPAIASINVPEPRTTRQAVETTPVASRNGKRAQSSGARAESPTASPTVEPTVKRRGRPPKRRRLDKSQAGNDEPLSAPPEEGAIPDTTLSEDVTLLAPDRDQGSAVHPLDVDATPETSSKRRRLASPENANRRSVPLHRASGNMRARLFTNDLISPKAEAAENGDISSVPPTPPVDRGSRRLVPEKTPRVPLAVERGGTVGVLRRKIIIDVVEKAGGAYPTGTAMWYPFATAWTKLNYKEKPDLRTVQSTIKHLVDAGRLRQLTFSGRNGKGRMVTKTMVTKPETSPDDPWVKELRQMILSDDRRIHFSPNIEIASDITKSGAARPYGQPPQQQKWALPVESSITVNLQQKPASVEYAEKRRERGRQKQLLKSLQADIGAYDDGRQGTGVKRLMKINRPSTTQEYTFVQTSISRPTEGKKRGRPRRDSTGVRRFVKMLSTLRPYAMLMNPGQTFHTTTGTFSTGTGSVAFRKPREISRRPPVDVQESVNELAQLARPADTTNFFTAADKILKWELQHGGVFDGNLGGFRSIDQTVHDAGFQTAPILGDIRFDVDQPAPALPTARPPMTTRKETSRRKQQQPPPPQQTPVDRRLERLADPAAVVEAPTPVPRPIYRRQRHARPLPEVLTRKLMIALVVVRILAGGAEAKLVDWVLVAACFPEQDPKFIEDRARMVLTKNRLQIAKMQRDFQERFIAAYIKNRVPPIDYGNIDNYDWPAVVEWADRELDVPVSENIPDLPATRQQFDSIFELREEPVTAADDFFQTMHSITIHRKRTMLAQIAFAIPTEGESQPAGRRKAELERLEVAKTWVRANVVTPEEGYNGAEAEKILSRFGEPLLNSAVQSLLTERVIGHSNRGRVIPGRNYDITDHFLHTLSRKRGIDSMQLHRAAYFKTSILDPQLQSTGYADVQYGADDGDILALINLATSGRVSLRPRDPPRDKFGLTDGGYLTRQMDKMRLRFAIEVRPLETYVYGNPIDGLATSIPAPSYQPSADPSLPPKIPLWLDINGQFVQRLWEKVAGAVVGCVAVRPGINAASIASMIKPAMGAWETSLLLGWLEQVGAVRRHGMDEQATWTVQEWWWMSLP
ncbi:hypothetical protein N7510_007744 [Penicillium lagena]|uniref:uncharacterized protein n=1 Tax=Penicillium lagena TaxID=94218 RepID=UPI0025423002|nr:uncharacterized protein N7510_007744 [Penicillium lagena]KAJ5611025.1 hypothetical protein N7510_007744 [Penicillium lagena]